MKKALVTEGLFYFKLLLMEFKDLTIENHLSTVSCSIGPSLYGGTKVEGLLYYDKSCRRWFIFQNKRNGHQDSKRMYKKYNYEYSYELMRDNIRDIQLLTKLNDWWW